MSTRTLARSLRAVLDARPDPLAVLATTAPVVRRAEFVTLNLARIETVAQVLARRPVPIPAWDYNHHFFDGTARTVNYLFLLDALNFSFWGDPKWTIARVGAHLDGYWALAAALKHAAVRDPSFLDADNLADLTPEALARVLRGNVEIPLFVERWRSARELGRVLRDRFGGDAARVVQAANGDAPRLAQLIANHFSSFDDRTIYQGHAVHLFKRAQILVADLYGSFGGEKWGAFKHLDALTAFADYKLPQILRAWGVLQYAPALARRVDRKIPLAKDSAEEVEIRAAMLWGVELLRRALAEHGKHLTSVQMDWFLWESSQHAVRGMKPYHRVRTIYY